MPFARINSDLSFCCYRPPSLLVGADDHIGPQPNRPLYTPKQNGFFDSGFAFAQNDTVFDGCCTCRSSDVILSKRSASKDPRHLAVLGATRLRADVVIGPYGEARTALKQTDKPEFAGTQGGVDHGNEEISSEC